MYDDLLPEEPSDLEPGVDEPSATSDLEFPEFPCAVEDDASWEAFDADDDERDPQPELGDFWTEHCLRWAA